MRFRTKRRIIIWISVFLLVVLYLFKNYSASIRVLSFIFGLVVFYFVDHAFHFHFPFRHYIYAIIVLFFGMLLSPLYFMYELYDKILHFVMPIFGCLVVFFVLDKAKIDLKYKLMATLLSVVFFLTIAEIGEYVLDVFWDLKLQGVYMRDATGLEKYKLILDENDDTMIDLILGISGCVVFVIGKSLLHLYKKRFSKKPKTLRVL